MPPKKRTAKARATTARRAAPRTARGAGRTARPPKPQSVTPYLIVSNAAEALDWYQKAFGAKVFSNNPAPGGKIMHAGLTIAQSQVFLSDHFPGMDASPPTSLGGTTVNLHLWVRDADKVWQRATAAGAKVAMPLDDQFWGDRYGKLTDPFGHSWAIGAKSKLSKQELEVKRQQAMEMFAKMDQGQGQGQGSWQS